MKKDNNRKNYDKGPAKGNYKREEKKRDFTFDKEPKKSRFESSDREKKGSYQDKRKDDTRKPSRYGSKPEGREGYNKPTYKPAFKPGEGDNARKRFEDKGGYAGKKSESDFRSEAPKRNFKDDKGRTYNDKPKSDKPYRSDDSRSSSKSGDYKKSEYKPRSSDKKSWDKDDKPYRSNDSRSSSRSGDDKKSEYKPRQADNKSWDRDDKPYNNRPDRREESRSEGGKSREDLPLEDSKLIYRGRGKDEKPVFGRVPKSGSDERGFRKQEKNPYAQEPIDPRPEYNFSKMEKNHRKNEDSDVLRLNKYISNSGICSRREADSLIQKGEIQVNGEVILEMGYKVQRIDKVTYKGKLIHPEKPVYILLNKPKDFITTTEDPEDRKTVMHLIKNACDERVFPVGRLDRNTTGLLLFTNDGELAAKLSHPSNQIKKIYQVTLDKPISKNDEEAILGGLVLEDGPVEVDDMQVLSKDRTILGLEIHAGRNRIVRRIFAHLGYEVVNLDRVVYAGLDKKDLPRGRFRFLSEKEVIRLKYF
jgi:23S rRNA pseudouridine2605 synthase